jgi:glycosyltransferase involved in cell wall biosynthesis
MNPATRIGPENAEIVVFNKGGRDFRYEQLRRGEEAPREFFYGFFDLEKAGYSAAMMSSSGVTKGPFGGLADLAERAFARGTGLGVRPLSVRVGARWIAGAKVAISYTDGFSLSLGLGYPGKNRPILMGGFHGLSDIEARTPANMRSVVRPTIARALAGLDHVFFFGPADRAMSMQRYGLSAERSSIIPFGVDTEFWRPMPEVRSEDFVVAVGQDRNRDYDLLAAAPGNHPIRIITRQKVRVPANAKNVEISAGDYFGSDAMTDQDLRRLYNTASAVVVPLKDVYQPTGYSVTLQAMACGRPVILSNIRGLWTQELLKSGENCILVPPGNAYELDLAVSHIRNDANFAAKLGKAARETAIAHFGLDRISAGTTALARLGLSLAAKR